MEEEEEESEEEEGWTLSLPEEEGRRSRGRGKRRRPKRRPAGKINIGKRRERCVPGKKGDMGGRIKGRERLSGFIIFPPFLEPFLQPVAFAIPISRLL